MTFMWSPTMMLASTTLITSTLMALSSTNWLFLWASMELNLLSFIPILISSKMNREIESAVKYFLAQALGSALLLTSSIMMWSPYSFAPSVTAMMLTMSILLKLGSAPCHLWYPSVMSGITWMSCTILSSWQKLAPLSILIFFTSITPKPIIPMMAAMNALFGGMMGMNQTQLRAIMAYSSIGHLGWIMAFMVVSKPALSMIYFMVYCTLILPLFLVFNYMNIMTSKQLSKASSIPFSTQMSLVILLLSLAGLPPLTGFMPKLMAITSLASQNISLILLLIVGSLMNLYYYLNIIVNMSLVNQVITFNYVRYTLKTKVLLFMSSVLSIGLLPLVLF
uniref:NADH-ubiquinone oxidoreductase chain 2 n=1 Tax=Perionyx excavatus TaxID=168854 RepID=A6YFE1_9ANNE|nr:NADH dehydrogenase subunit 2 [Perionyx excavatus]ABQ01592.1 NADH dehydrogenase subunit 2 [Perionyx excavatus]